MGVKIKQDGQWRELSKIFFSKDPVFTAKWFFFWKMMVILSAQLCFLAGNRLGKLSCGQVQIIKNVDSWW